MKKYVAEVYKPIHSLKYYSILRNPRTTWNLRSGLCINKEYPEVDYTLELNEEMYNAAVLGDITIDGVKYVFRDETIEFVRGVQIITIKLYEERLDSKITLDEEDIDVVDDQLFNDFKKLSDFTTVSEGEKEGMLQGLMGKFDVTGQYYKDMTTLKEDKARLEKEVKLLRWIIILILLIGLILSVLT